MATASFPARCAVSVICGDHLVSQVYPAAVPIESYIDSVVELLGDDLRRRGAADLDPMSSYELYRANGTRLDISKTLADLGVEDGATLVLAPARDGDSFEPQCESLSTELARIGKQLFTPVSAATAAYTALAILGLAILTICGLAIYVRARFDSLTPSLVTGLLGIGVAAGVIALSRRWPDRTDLRAGLSWLAVPLVTVCLASAAPGDLGTPHIFIAVIATAVATISFSLLTHRHVSVAAGVATVCLLAGLGAGVRLMRTVPSQWMGIGTLISLLILLTAAPTVALWAARIRPPHFGSITGLDLFRRNDGLPVDAVAPVEDEQETDSGRDRTPGSESVITAAVRANEVLTGICLGASAALPVAVWAALAPGGTRGNAAAVLASLFVVIFISRARAFSDRRQAVALVVGASAAVCAGVVRYVAHFGGLLVGLCSGALVLTAFATAGLAAGFLVPITRFTPLVRLAAEWVELAAVVAALPLAAWISGLFTWVRMR